MAETVQDLRGELRRWPQYSDAFRLQAIGVGPAEADVMADPHTVPMGVFGVGVWMEVRNEAVPALFVQPRMAPTGPVPVLRSAVAPLAGLRDEELFRGVVAVPVGQPQRFGYYAPGASITIGSYVATAGFPVLTDDGRQGFLTAGHSAPLTGVVVRDGAGDALGTVLRTSPPVGPPTIPVADVAVVETNAPSAIAGTRPSRNVRAGESISLQGARGALTSWVRGLSPEYWVSPTEPPWAEVALTANPISMPGDSGAPVYVDDNIPVATLVGGTVTGYSVVQDLATQLTAIGASLR